LGLAEAREERVRGNMSFADSPLNELNGELIDQRPGRWAEIVEKIRSDDESGVEELYSALCDGARSKLFRLVGPQSDEDRLHEVLVIVMEAIRTGELRDPQRLMGFVRTVTRRQVAAHIRGAITGRRRMVAVSGAEPTADAESPESVAAAQEQVQALRKVLSRLNPRDREILVRFYLHEQDRMQICGEMGLTDTQFRLYKSRAIARCSDLAQQRASGQPRAPHRAHRSILNAG
jgi:RNA polymerase sigma-70 factor (ECF subfamily)